MRSLASLRRPGTRWWSGRTTGSRSLRLLVVLGLVLTSMFGAPLAASATAPGNTVTPLVSGDALVGSTLNATAGTWTGTPQPTFTYRWQYLANNGTWPDIAGATAQSYTVQPSDLGHSLRVNVTGTNSAGYAEQVSEGTTTVANGPNNDNDNVPNPPADVLGTPGNSRVVSSDRLLLTRDDSIGDPNIGDTDHTVSGQVLTPDATGNITAAPNPQASLTSTDTPHFFPRLTATGRFADPNTDGVLSLSAANGAERLVVSSDGLSAAGGVNGESRTLTPGQAYFFQGVQAPNQTGLRRVPDPSNPTVTWTKPAADGNGRTVRAANTWTAAAVPGTAAPGRPNGVMLVNRALGDCLAAVTDAKSGVTTVRTAPCVWGGAVPATLLWQSSPSASRPDAFYLVSQADGRVMTRDPSGSVILAAKLTPFTPAQTFYTLTVEATPVQQTFVDARGGDVPTWAVKASPLAMAFAGGDLDRVSVAGTTLTYHDEAAVAWVGQDGVPQLRVLDYAAVPGSITVTAPSVALPAVGQPASSSPVGQVAAGSVGLAVGDFDGDSLNELAFTWQDGNGVLRVTLLAYRQTASGGHALTVIGDPGGTPLFGLDQAGAPAALLSSGVTDTKAGDFDGDGRDDLAVAYAATPAGGVLTGYLGVRSFNTDFSLRGQQSSKITGSALWTSPIGSPSTSSTRGLRLVPGLFKYSPDTGFTMNRRQLAVAWTEGGAATAQSTYVSAFSADPAASCTTTQCTLAIDELTPRSGGTTLVQTSPASGGYYSLPLSLAAGGFKGRGTNGDPPLWGLALTVNDTGENDAANANAQLYMLGVQGAAIKQLSKTPLPFTPNVPVSYTVAPYDIAGDSLQLGAPAIVQISNLEKATLIAAQPPAHSDWTYAQLASPNAGGSGFQNISRSENFVVTLGSSTSTQYQHTTTHKSGWNAGFSVANDIKGSFALNAGVGAVSASVQDKTQFSANWNGSVGDKEQYSSTNSLAITQTTSDDDAIQAQVTNSTLYRYPILGGPLTNADGSPATGCTSNCYGFYDVVIPGDVTNISAGGSDLDFYSPSWENGNAMSYPSIASVSTPADLGTYTYYNSSGTSTQGTGVLFSETNGVGASAATDALQLTSSTGLSNSSSSGNNWKLSNTTKVTGSLRIGTKADNSTYADSFSIGENGGQSLVGTDDGGTTNTSGSSFILKVPAIDKDKAYNVGTTYYYDKAGAARVDMGADLPLGPPGTPTWWADEYGTAPDPALNLPNSTFVHTANRITKVRFNTGASAQAIRGFQLLHPLSLANDPGSLAGTPYTSNPIAGDQVVISVPIHNYSFKTATQVPVTFYAVPLTSDPVPVNAGPPVNLGTTTVASIDPRGVQLASPPQNWTASIPSGVAGSQTWRIFVVIDPANSLQELHPWKGGAPCPSGDLDPNPAAGTIINGVMVDPMTGQASTLACAQNNQGFGIVTVSPADAATPSGLRNTTVLGVAAQRTPATKAGVRFHGAGLVTGNPSHLQLGAGEIPTVKLDQELTGITYGTSDRASTEIQPVVVYDGPPAAKNVIAVTSLAGVDRTHYGRAEFSWRPTTPGLHTITTRLLGTPTAGDDDLQTFQVLVQAPAPPPTTPPTHPTQPVTPPPAAAPQLVNTGGGPLGWLITLGVALVGLGVITALATRRRLPVRTQGRLHGTRLR